MTLLFTNSFEADSGSSGSGSRWTSGSCGVSTTGARTGTKAVFSSSYRYQVFATEEHATFIAGAAFRHAASANPALVFMSDSGVTTHVTVNYNASTHALDVFRGTTGGTLLGSTPANTIDNVNSSFQYVEAIVTLSDTVGTVAIYIDEVLQLNLTGQDTKNAGTKTVFDSVQWNSVSSISSNATLDDVYLCNGAGSVNNSVLGAVHIVPLHPNGNGSHSDWTGSDSDQLNNYLLVQDQTLPVTTDYVQTGSTGNEDTYTFDDLVGYDNTATVKGIVQVAYAEKLDSGARVLTHVARLAGATPLETTVDSPKALVNGVFNFHHGIQELKPGATAWTVTDVNNAEFGVKAS